jgi:hypothetical protein
MVQFPIDEADIISQVSREYDESIEFTHLKRDLFKRRDSLYLGIDNSDTKVYVRLVYSVVDTMLALEMDDKRSVIFHWRQWGMDEYADSVNNCAKYDYEQMWCETKKYFARKHKYLKGVGIEVMDWWDKTLDVPTYKVISPMVWCPDWFAWVNNWPRYHWFEYQAQRWELENDDTFFGIDTLLTQEQLDSLARQERTETYWNRELNQIPSNNTSDILSLYYHYTIIKGIKYLVVLGNDRTTICKFEEVPAITDIEKKDKTKIQFPVICRYFRPLENDPFGVSVPDLLEDKQTMMQLFLNLNRIKAEHEAYWDMFLFDPDKIDVDNFKIPTLWPKYVPVSWLAWLNSTPMTPVAKQQVSPDAYNMPSILMSESTLTLGMDQRTLWTTPSGTPITKWENIRVQANSNMRLLLWLKWDNIAEKQFWGIWYRYYLLYFNKEKSFRLNDGLWWQYYSIAKKDFKWLTDIDIEIIAESDLDTLKEKEKIAFMAVSNMILSDPTITPNTKKFIQRELMILNWIPKEKAMAIIPPSQEEQQAYLDLELLNRNEMPSKITDMAEDHWTYVVIYQRALDTDAKWKAIQARLMAAKMAFENSKQMAAEQQQMWQEQPQQWWATNKSISNMLVNDMIQWQGQSSMPSLETI